MSENKTCRILFMGTPGFAVPCLRMLMAEGYEVIGVVTQPDRPKGRKKELVPSPVKAVAAQCGLPVYQPEKLRETSAVEALVSLEADLVVTAAYGQILPKSLLRSPRYGCMNVHASLLPKYRGGAPIHHAIMNGETVTGVTIMYMAEGLDTGDMISSVEVPIGRTVTTGELYLELAAAGAELLRTTLPDILAGRAVPVPQNHALATYAPNIRREDERIDWSKSASAINNQVRGLHPEPIAYTHLKDQVWKIWVSEVDEAGNGNRDDVIQVAAPGTILSCDDGGIRVQTGDGVLRITVIQPPGKKAMAVKDFLRGRTFDQGARFGEDRP